MWTSPLSFGLFEMPYWSFWLLIFVSSFFAIAYGAGLSPKRAVSLLVKSFMEP